MRPIKRGEGIFHTVPKPPVSPKAGMRKAGEGSVVPDHRSELYRRPRNELLDRTGRRLLYSSKDVKLSAEKTRRVTLSIKSKQLRRKLSRAYRSSGNRKIRAKLIIRGRTASGVRDYSSRTVMLRPQ